MTAQTETVDAQPQDPRKVRLTGDQIDDLAEARRIAAVSMRNSATLAEALDDRFVAQACIARAEKFESMLAEGQGLTRITVRF